MRVYYFNSAHEGLIGSAARVTGGENASTFWRLTRTVVYKL